MDGGDIEKVANRWELQNYLDAGPNGKKNPQLFCECGRPLRYQYIVENKETNEFKKFGITHFEEHIGIPPNLVKEIVKGIEKIDYEGDEILTKIATGWKLSDEGIKNLPVELEIPRDIQQHFDYLIPLLERQVQRLKRLLSEVFQEKERQRKKMMLKEREKIQQRKREEIASRKQEISEEMGWLKDTHQNLDKPLQLGVMVYLESLNTTYFRASEVCKDLVEYHHAPNDSYSSGRLTIFPDVCLFLEYLVQQGILEFMRKQDGVDRVYRIISDHQ